MPLSGLSCSIKLLQTLKHGLGLGLIVNSLPVSLPGSHDQTRAPVFGLQRLVGGRGYWFKNSFHRDFFCVVFVVKLQQSCWSGILQKAPGEAGNKGAEGVWEGKYPAENIRMNEADKQGREN